MDFGIRLRELLDERDLSQKEFAAMLSIAPTTLNGYINGKREPSLELIVTIAKTMGVSTDYLLGLGIAGEELSASELSLISKLRRISPRGQEVICEMADVLLELSE